LKKLQGGQAMKLSIETVKLVGLLSTAIKGIGNKHARPITEYFQIKVEDNRLMITATNDINFITVATDVESGNGEVVVKADKLFKLIQKTTKRQVTLEKKDSYLEVKGNGTYKVEITDEEFPTYEFDEDVPGTAIDIKSLRKAFSVNKATVAENMVVPELTGYRVGLEVVTTDGVKMCVNHRAGTDIEDTLFSPHMVRLIDTISAEEGYIQLDKGNIYISAGDIFIFGPELDGLGEYPDIQALLERLNYNSSVNVNREELWTALDRLLLFVDEFDNDGISLTFYSDRIEARDLKENSVEIVEVKTENEFEPIKIGLNINYVMDILGAIIDGQVCFSFGEGLPVRIAAEDLVFLLGTMEI
jgi:DNA polymerase-3 subunit beta